MKEVQGTKYVYGMRLRGFSPGCQPMNGFLAREDDITGTFWDILVYSRLLTEKELKDYDLTLIAWRDPQ